MTAQITPSTERKLVVVGSSAGGVEALMVLVSTLPADFAAPIVLAQHLDPARHSNLGAILARRSALPVTTIEGRVRLQPGHVYVAPSNQHLVIEDGHVATEQHDRDRPRPSIDRVLSTAAQVYGEGLFAVILSGSGSDGADGAIQVKAHGGTVVVQNPQTARYPSMPLALPPTIVDHVLDLDRLGPLLADLVGGVSLPEADLERDADLGAILGYLGKQTSVDFRAYKPTTILRRIARRMAVTHTRNLADYGRYLEEQSGEVAELMMAFLIKVTEFLRDDEAFVQLRQTIIPQLIERGREQGRVLRFWSAGCATGEEPYSLAMLVAETLGAELPEWTVKIFATDLDGSAIGFARRGIYPRAVLDKLPDGYVERFFERIDGGYQISKQLRGMVIFGQQDLGRGVPFPRIDLIVCRNLLIYFKPELQQHVLDLFAYSLHQTRGFLFLGKAESARPSNASFEVVDKRWKLYRCAQGPLQRSARGEPRAQSERRPVADDAPSPATAGEPDATQLRRFDESVLRNLPFGSVVVDRAYHLVSANAAARRLLGIRDAAQTQDFLHAVRGLPYATVRSAIDQVFRERGPVTLNDLELERPVGDDVRWLTIALVPMQSESVDYAVVSISDATETVLTRQRVAALQAEQSHLVTELSAANKRLSDLNKDLQDANEELQAANEEMVITQEELQATNEELETTNEEMQATNEELETNNEELQATNEELEATNEELNVRTAELHQMSRTLVVQSRTQEELRHLDRMKDEFLSLVSHELRTPMVTLKGYADLLKEGLTGGGPAPQLADYAGRVGKQIDQLGRMIDDLFDVARMHNGQLALELEDVDLVALVREVVAGHLGAQKLELDVDDGPLLVRADPGRIEQVLTNLLFNASTHAATSPRVVVRLRREHASTEGMAPNGLAVIEVEDDGPGLSEESLKSLFQRFFQAPLRQRPARAGLGLGLYLCRQIVERHGGTIEARSAPERGATFVVRLPLAVPLDQANTL